MRIRQFGALLLQAVAGANAEVVSAFWTHMLVLLHCFTPDDLIASVALLPEAFGLYRFLAVGKRAAVFDGGLLPVEPCHGNRIYGSMRAVPGAHKRRLCGEVVGAELAARAEQAEEASAYQCEGGAFRGGSGLLILG